MIIGSGLLASAFSKTYSHRDDVCIYAAGVSNSSCTNPQEFIRERNRLESAISENPNVNAFVYFSTCSIFDAERLNTPYVKHKLAMEQLVRLHSSNLILRLPQVAGKTANPHTLLNFLYSRICRSESFDLWSNAQRNIIDVDDVLLIANQFIFDDTVRNISLNIANQISYSMVEIVQIMEAVVGKTAVFKTIDYASKLTIDVNALLPVLKSAGVSFDKDYLERVIRKYYQ